MFAFNRREILKSGAILSTVLPQALFASPKKGGAVQNTQQNGKHQPYFFIDSQNNGQIYYQKSPTQCVTVLQHGWIDSPTGRPFHYQNKTHVECISQGPVAPTIWVLTNQRENESKARPTLYTDTNVFQFFEFAFLLWNAQAQQVELLSILEDETEFFDAIGDPTHLYLPNYRCLAVLTPETTPYAFVMVLSLLNHTQLCFLGYDLQNQQWVKIYEGDPCELASHASFVTEFHFLDKKDYESAEDLLQVFSPSLGLRLLSYRFDLNEGLVFTQVGSLEIGDYLHTEWCFNQNSKDFVKDKHFAFHRHEQGKHLHLYSSQEQLKSLYWEKQAEGNYAPVAFHVRSPILERDYKFLNLTSAHTASQLPVGFNCKVGFHTLKTLQNSDSAGAAFEFQPLQTLNEHPLIQKAISQARDAKLVTDQFVVAVDPVSALQSNEEKKIPDPTYRMHILSDKNLSNNPAHQNNILTTFHIRPSGHVDRTDHPAAHKKSNSAGHDQKVEHGDPHAWEAVAVLGGSFLAALSLYYFFPGVFSCGDSLIRAYPDDASSTRSWPGSIGSGGQSRASEMDPSNNGDALPPITSYDSFFDSSLPFVTSTKTDDDNDVPGPQSPTSPVRIASGSSPYTNYQSLPELIGLLNKQLESMKSGDASEPFDSPISRWIRNVLFLFQAIDNLTSRDLMHCLISDSTSFPNDLSLNEVWRTAVGEQVSKTMALYEAQWALLKQKFKPGMGPLSAPDPWVLSYDYFEILTGQDRNCVPEGISEDAKRQLEIFNKGITEFCLAYYFACHDVSLQDKVTCLDKILNHLEANTDLGKTPSIELLSVYKYLTNSPRAQCDPFYYRAGGDHLDPFQRLYSIIGRWRRENTFDKHILSDYIMSTVLTPDQTKTVSERSSYFGKVRCVDLARAPDEVRFLNYFSWVLFQLKYIKTSGACSAFTLKAQQDLDLIEIFSGTIFPIRRVLKVEQGSAVIHAASDVSFIFPKGLLDNGFLSYINREESKRSVLTAGGFDGTRAGDVIALEVTYLKRAQIKSFCGIPESF